MISTMRKYEKHIHSKQLVGAQIIKLDKADYKAGHDVEHLKLRFLW